jgi:type I restriction enzyme S subunit
MQEQTDKRPANWTRAALGDVTAERVAQGGPGGRRDFVYVDISSIDNTAKRITEPKTIKAEDAPSRARQNLQAGDVLVSMTRPNLNAVAVVSPDQDGAIGSTGFHVLRSTPSVIPGWLYYAVLTDDFIHSMSRLVQGALYPAVRPKDIRAYELSVPPRAEQRRIVSKIDELFSDLDAGVAALRRVKANLKRYRAAVLNAAVTGKLTAEWRKQNPPTESADKLLARILEERRKKWEAEQLRKCSEAGRTPPKGWKDKGVAGSSLGSTALAVLPGGWCWARVGDIGRVQLGRQRAPQHHTGENMRTYLRVANVFENRIDVDDVMEMNFTPSEYKTYQLHPNDILLNEGQSMELIGRPAIYRGEVPGACFTNTLVRFQSGPAIIPAYALMVFLAYLKNGRFQKIATITVNIAHLGAGRFADLEFPVPSLAEQGAIVAEVERHLSVVDVAEIEVQRGLKRAARLRQAILKRAFEGRLVPQDPSDEPSTVMVERAAGAEQMKPALSPKQKPFKESRRSKPAFARERPFDGS